MGETLIFYDAYLDQVLMSIKLLESSPQYFVFETGGGFSTKGTIEDLENQDIYFIGEL